MNINEMANAAVSNINPNIAITIKQYAGQTILPNGKAEITYNEYVVEAQVQPIDSFKQQLLSGFAHSGVYKEFWVNGDVRGISDKPNGNDFVVLPNGETYKVIDVPEAFYETAGWTKFVGVRQ